MLGRRHICSYLYEVNMDNDIQTLQKFYDQNPNNDKKLYHFLMKYLNPLVSLLKANLQILVKEANFAESTLIKLMMIPNLNLHLKD